MKNIKLQKSKKHYKFYDDLGHFLWGRISGNIIKLFAFSLIYQFLYLVHFRILDIGVIFSNINNIEILFFQYIDILQNFYLDLSLDSFMNSDVNLFLAPFYILIFYIIIIIYMYKKSRFQLKLSNLGLENYKLIKKRYGYLLILKYGEEIEFDYVHSIAEDLKQVLKIYKNIYIARYKKCDIKIEFEKEFRNSNAEFNELYKKLKESKIYLGQKLENNKIINNYIDMEYFQRVAILGTSGGGKSNLINLILYNLLYNFKNIESLLFVDFKGGIEGYPLLKVAQTFGLNLKIATDIEKLETYLLSISEQNNQRMEHNKQYSLKKYDGKTIYIIYDEFAQIGLHNSVNDEEKLSHKNIMSIYSRLHATGRSQQIYNITITQSFLRNASGIPTDAKTNIDTKILFKTDNNESIYSVFSSDILEENQFNPKQLNIGEYILQNNNTLSKCKANLVSDDTEYYFHEILRRRGYKPILSQPPTNEQFQQSEYLKNKVAYLVQHIIFYRQQFHFIERFLDEQNIFYKYLSSVDKTHMITLQKIKMEKQEKNEKIKKMIIMSLLEQIEIRKHTYGNCKFITDDAIRKEQFIKLREFKSTHDNNLRIDDLEFDNVIANARAIIKSYTSVAL